MESEQGRRHPGLEGGRIRRPGRHPVSDDGRGRLRAHQLTGHRGQDQPRPGRAPAAVPGGLPGPDARLGGKAIPGHFGNEAKAIHKRAVASFDKKIYELNKALDFLEDQSVSRPRLSDLPVRNDA